MEDAGLADLEYRAEFERRQFDLYDARRLAAETHASAVIAAALGIAALVANDYSRASHPRLIWLLFALVGLMWAFLLANVARFVAWTTSRWSGGTKWVAHSPLPSTRVGETLDAVRQASGEDSLALRGKALEHWKARADSAWRLGALKDKRLRLALWGFVGPLAYFAARLFA